MKNFSLFFSLWLAVFLSFSVKAQWVLQHAPGLPNSSQPQLIFSPVNDNVCWGKNSNNSQFVRTTDGGDNWTVSTVTNAAGLECSSISALDAVTAWIAMNDPSNVTSGGIFKTTDGGLNWIRDTTAFQGSGGHPNVIHFFDADNGLCIGNPRGGYWEIYTTTDGGSNWIRVPSANIPAPLTNESGIETSYDPPAGNYFWFPTLRNRLYRTTDQGYTWTVADSVTGGPSQIGFGFAFKDNLNGLAADFYPISVISSTSDGGETWEPMVPYPPGLSTISSLFIVYAKGTDSSYVITSQTDLGGNPMMPGTAYSDDNGHTWTQVSNLPCGPAVFSSCNRGWCGSINDSIYHWESDTLLCTTVAVEQENNSFIPNGFVLQQNYPNPFNPSTTIRYSIPASLNPSQGGTLVILKVYDLLGREMTTLVKKVQTAGVYEIEFDASELSSGIYIYKLQSGSFVESKKMILLR
jgi:photosystem II stability/assembly factor-like uncharacterized protein